MELTDPCAAQRRNEEENMNTPHSSVNTLTQAIHTHKIKHTDIAHTNTNSPQELGSSGSHFNDASSQPLALHHRWHRGQAVSLHQPACHPRGCRTLSWWHNDSQAVVTATTHGSAPGIYHEADQEAEEKVRQEIKYIYF